MKRPMNEEITLNLDIPHRIITCTAEEHVNAMLNAMTDGQKMETLKMVLDDLVNDSEWIDNAIEAIGSKIDEQ